MPRPCMTSAQATQSAGPQVLVLNLLAGQLYLQSRECLMADVANRKHSAQSLPRLNLAAAAQAEDTPALETVGPGLEQVSWGGSHLHVGMLTNSLTLHFCKAMSSRGEEGACLVFGFWHEHDAGTRAFNPLSRPQSTVLCPSLMHCPPPAE